MTHFLLFVKSFFCKIKSKLLLKIFFALDFFFFCAILIYEIKNSANSTALQNKLTQTKLFFYVRYITKYQNLR